jgi:hypothetical protein
MVVNRRKRRVIFADSRSWNRALTAFNLVLYPTRGFVHLAGQNRSFRRRRTKERVGQNSAPRAQRNVHGRARGRSSRSRAQAVDRGKASSPPASTHQLIWKCLSRSALTSFQYVLLWLCSCLDIRACLCVLKHLFLKLCMLIIEQLLQ